ncbi:MAG: hypothetical protein OH363_04960 [Candidatus Parvarchaeota archaeon]|nr:hypothetical protein [Candidatus Jingweiarchaeum tengchongense]
MTQVKFEGGNFNIAGLETVSATQSITSPTMFEFAVRGLASAYNWADPIFLGNNQVAASLIKTANESRAATISMVAKYLQLPVSQQISQFENNQYIADFYKPNTDIQAALNALATGTATETNNSQNVFDSDTLQQIQSNIQSKLAAQNWQVQYFQIDQINVITGTGDKAGYQFVDGATWLVSAVPLPNAAPLQFVSKTGSNRYGGPILDAIIIAMVIVGTIVAIIAFSNLTVVIKNATVAVANAIGKNAPAVVTSLAVGGAVVVGVVLAIMLLIANIKGKHNNQQKAGGG